LDRGGRSNRPATCSVANSVEKFEFTSEETARLRRESLEKTERAEAEAFFRIEDRLFWFVCP
jgi:hypothetical protein